MTEDIQEGFEKTRIAGIVAAGALDEVAKIIKPGKVNAIAGVNLSMLIRSISYRHESFDTLIAKAIEGAQDGIIHIQSNQSC